MNTGSKILVEPNVAKMLDPYSTPRTIPGGWDVSAMVVKKKMSAMKTPSVEPSVSKMLDPYSNPRTIPGGWDVSAFSTPAKNGTFGDGSFNPGTNGQE